MVKNVNDESSAQVVKSKGDEEAFTGAVQVKS
jgi:hypothetical protein